MYPPINAPALDTRLQAIRKTTVAFASLFKDIPFIKYDNITGEEIERIKVPIIYGDKEKYVKRLDIPNEKVQITLPRIEYGLLDMQYDSSRRTNQSNKILGCSSDGSAYVPSPIPYNFNFELVLYTRNIEDANQIKEYILPFFIPDYNLRINMVPSLGIIKNVPITFSGESEEEDSNGSSESPVRSVFRTLRFVARSFIYQPLRYYKPILQAETNVIIPNNYTNEYLVTSGNGNFIIGETVFQGETYNSATLIATILDWNKDKKSIKLNVIRGKVNANSKISNIYETSKYLIENLPTSGLIYTSIITPTPNTYPVTGPYEYNIIIKYE